MGFGIEKAKCELFALFVPKSHHMAYRNANICLTRSGSIVQPHTNLTEIKLATELLWRNDVNPSKVCIGYGFYGRSFTLADSSCSDPGCPFSDAANPGVCTGTGGYLSYYEIKDILERTGIEPVWDKEAAVKYFKFDDNQWVSYDDEDTFQQKIDWANEIGFSGALIWASDLDDYEFSAHTALMGETFESNIKIRKKAVSAALSEIEAVDLMEASLDSSCYREKECRNMEMYHCESGYKLVGWDLEDCEGGWPFIYRVSVHCFRLFFFFLFSLLTTSG